MGRADRISGVFWLVFSLVMAFESYGEGLGTLRQPGPGFLYFWTSIVLALMSLPVLIQGRAGWEKAGAEAPIFGKGGNRKILLVLVSLILYASLMETLGFIPVTLLLFFFLLGRVERKGWVFTAFVSVVVTAASYLVFEVWLMSQLPRGLLEGLRF